MTAKQLLGLYTIGWLLISLTACTTKLVYVSAGSEGECNLKAAAMQEEHRRNPALPGVHYWSYSPIQKTCEIYQY
jgi:hypothetical protein